MLSGYKCCHPLTFACTYCEQYRMFSCQMCDFKTNKDVFLAQHYQEEKLVCDKCSFHTSTKKSLNIHRERKHDPKEYFCVGCDFRCTNKGTLRKHNERKHSRKKHLCNLCDFQVEHAEYLKQHKEHMHKNDNIKSELSEKEELRVETRKKVNINAILVHMNQNINDILLCTRNQCMRKEIHYCVTRVHTKQPIEHT